MMICKRGQLSDAQCGSTSRTLCWMMMKTFLEITTLKFRSLFHTELQEVVLEKGERGRRLASDKPIGGVSSIRAETVCNSMHGSHRLSITYGFVFREN